MNHVGDRDSRPGPRTFLAAFRRRLAAHSEAVRLILLGLIGLLVAWPFLSGRALGSGEAYNYSLATADTIAQVRQGVVPVFVGQSKYAFNGRVHPLRTAVYYTHSAALLDFLTLRRLTPWHVHNLNLALSLIAVFYSAYFALGLAPGLSRWLRWLLATWFALAPGLLAAAHGSELYMTATAAPFLPWAVMGAVRGAQVPALKHYAAMVIGLAGAWLAHPPVAAWTSLGCAALTLGGWVAARRKLAAAGALALCLGLGALLSVWAFASAVSLPGEALPANTAAQRLELARALGQTIAAVGWQALLPVSSTGTALGDFQLGYAGWALLALASIAVLRGRCITAWLLWLVILFFFALTLPIPWVGPTLWANLPAAFTSITNIWPMQRAYLVISAHLIALVALVAPASVLLHVGSRGRRVALVALGLAAGAWTAHEAWRFVSVNLHFQRSAVETERMYRSGNRTLSSTGYAFLGLPDNFVTAPRQPEHELKITSFVNGERVLADNATDGGAPVLRAEGIFRIAPGASAESWPLTPALVLEPGKRYRLRLEFIAAPVDALLSVSGPLLWQQFPMRHEEGRRAFGMAPGQSRSLPLATEAAAAETINLSLTPRLRRIPAFTDFARFWLEEINPAALPVRLHALSPSLRCSVDAPDAGWLETPRMFVPGYAARVDGQPVVPRRGADGRVLVPVPAGRHEVEVSYRAPVGLRAAALITLATWCAVLVFLAIPSAVLGRLRDRALGVFGGDYWRTHPARWAVPTVIAAAAGFAALLQSTAPRRLAGDPGALRLTVALPLDHLGASEPLFSAGRGEGSVIGFVRHLDNETITVGLDTWGAGVVESEPLKLDFRDPIQLTVASGPLWEGPLPGRNDPDAARTAWFRARTQIWLNDRRVLVARSAPAQIPMPPVFIGENRTGTNSHRNRFGGAILHREWLPMDRLPGPIPTRREWDAAAGPLALRVVLPSGQTGQCEPLIAFGDKAAGVCLFVHYLDGAHISLGFEGAGCDRAVTPPIPVTFGRPVEIAVSHPSLYPAGHALLSGYSAQQRASLTGRLHVTLNGRHVLATRSLLPASADTGRPHFGLNPGIAAFPSAEFSGEMISSRREPTAEWPVPPGDPESATRSELTGPIALIVRLPLGQTGRSQPLLVTGRTGEGMIVLVQYLDDRSIRLGVDVWNKALFWSAPLPADFAVPHTVVVSASALYPPLHKELARLGSAAAESLRNALDVSFDGRTVISEKIYAYEAGPGQITAGRTTIGGSNSETEFLGDLIAVRRLPVPGR
jgi:hypothetical protein